MAREVVDYHRQLELVRPDYDDCPEPCVETGEEQSELCKVCPLEKQWGYFKEGFDDAITEKFGEEKIKWSFDRLYRDVRFIINFNAQLEGKSYPSDADALTVACLHIWRDEKFRPDRIEEWELRRKAEREANGK